MRRDRSSGPWEHKSARGLAQSKTLRALGRAAFTAALLLALAGPAPAAQPAAPSGGGSRYLLVVETSRSMRTRSKAMLRTVQELLGGAMQGQLRGGDTVGLWTFNQDLYAGLFPLEVWAPGQQQAIGGRALGFLKARHYENQPNLGKVMGALEGVVKDSEALTIILISTGGSQIHGTPFDERINDLFARWHSERQNQRVPLVTVLRARNGKLTNCSVRPASEPVEFPPMPPPERPVVREGPPAPAPQPAAQMVPPPVAPPLILSGRKPLPDAGQTARAESPVNPKPAPKIPVEPALAGLDSTSVGQTSGPPVDASFGGVSFLGEDTPGNSGTSGPEAPLTGRPEVCPTAPSHAQVPSESERTGGASAGGPGPSASSVAANVMVTPASSPASSLASAPPEAAPSPVPAVAVSEPAAPPQASTSVVTPPPPASNVARVVPPTPEPARPPQKTTTPRPMLASSRLSLCAGAILASGCVALGFLRRRGAREAPQFSLITCSLDGGRSVAGPIAAKPKPSAEGGRVC